MLDPAIWGARRETQLADQQGQLYDLAFQARVDQSRLISSAAFRRLQGKTQVMQAGEHEFFRTRLTHSLEVAQIGASLTDRLHWFAQSQQALPQALIPAEQLIETACLAHDIGHPPYGHNSEEILNYFMLEQGGFEGNGQTFNMLCNLGEYSQQAGYDFSRRSLLSVVKYPVLYGEVAPDYPPKPQQLPQNIHPWMPPKCLHDDDAETFEWLLEPFCEADKKTFRQTRVHSSSKQALKRSIYKSFDCSIMELADDIAYGVHDLEDALAMGLLQGHQVAADLQTELAYLAELRNKPHDYYQSKLSSSDPRLLKQAITNIVRTLVFQTLPQKQECFEHPLLDWQIVMPAEPLEVLTRLKHYIFAEVIEQPNLRSQGYKGKVIIAALFEALLAQPEDLIPRSVYQRAEERGLSKHRLVCDYIASMTDQEAANMYKRLFLPDRGSIFQPL